MVIGVVREGQRPLAQRVMHNFNGEVDEDTWQPEPVRPPSFAEAVQRGAVVPAHQGLPQQGQPPRQYGGTPLQGLFDPSVGGGALWGWEWNAGPGQQ